MAETTIRNWFYEERHGLSHHVNIVVDPSSNGSPVRILSAVQTLWSESGTTMILVAAIQGRRHIHVSRNPIDR